MDLQSDVRQIRKELSALRGDVAQLATDLNTVLNKILRAVSNPSERLFTDSDANSCNTSPTESSTRRGRTQSEPSISVQLQVGKHQQTDTTLQAIPEETASTAPDVLQASDMIAVKLLIFNIVTYYLTCIDVKVYTLKPV